MILYGIQGSSVGHMLSSECQSECQSGSQADWIQISAATQRCMLTAYYEDLHVLLRRYSDVFQEPKGIPPAREHVHRIPLKDESRAVAVRPYRYPDFPKNEIEKPISEMDASAKFGWADLHRCYWSERRMGHGVDAWMIGR